MNSTGPYADEQDQAIDVDSSQFSEILCKAHKNGLYALGDVVRMLLESCSVVRSSLVDQGRGKSRSSSVM